MFSFQCITFQMLPFFEDSKKNKSNPNLQRYEALVEVSQLPLDLPTASNYAEVKSVTYDDYSHALERGLAISAGAVHYDENTKRITLSFDKDSYLHGVIPSEQTYEIIKNYIINSSLPTNNTHVGLAIMTGIISRFW